VYLRTGKKSYHCVVVLSLWSFNIRPLSSKTVGINPCCDCEEMSRQGHPGRPQDGCDNVCGVLGLRLAGSAGTGGHQWP
jgi:hypothetical protein